MSLNKEQIIELNNLKMTSLKIKISIEMLDMIIAFFAG